MNRSRKQWVGLIMAIVGVPVGALLPTVLGQLVSAIGAATGAAIDMRDTSPNTALIFGLPLLVGIGLEIWALVIGVRGLRKASDGSTSRGVAIWTVVIAGVSGLFLLTPFLFVLAQAPAQLN